jgi:hypothetical protein
MIAAVLTAASVVLLCNLLSMEVTEQISRKSAQEESSRAQLKRVTRLPRSLLLRDCLKAGGFFEMSRCSKDVGLF